MYAYSDTRDFFAIGQGALQGHRAIWPDSFAANPKGKLISSSPVASAQSTGAPGARHGRVRVRKGLDVAIAGAPSPGIEAAPPPRTVAVLGGDYVANDLILVDVADGELTFTTQSSADRAA